MKALLLAAGYGSRLRPLTDHLPKPLTLFMGRPILDLVYQQVCGVGIQAVAVNTHHLPETIRQHIQSSRLYSQPVHLSHEPEILGTGGCLNPLRPWLGEEDVLIFNGDIITSLDLRAFVHSFQRSLALAGMVLLPYKEGTTPVYAREGRVVSIGEAADGEKRTFAGIHILGAAFVRQVPEKGFQSIIDTYQKILAVGGLIMAFLDAPYWADLGIPRDYLEAHQSLLRHPQRAKICQALYLRESEWIYDKGQKTLFIDSPVTEGFKRSFVFGPVLVEGPIQLEQCIVYPHTRLPRHTHEFGKIISSFASLNIV